MAALLSTQDIGIATAKVKRGHRRSFNGASTAMSSWPTEIRLSKDRRTLHVSFDDGAAHALSAELLRVESPSAEVQGHGPTQKKTIPGKADVEIIKVEPVGHYAVKLTFDDMHDTGLFGWGYLYDLGREYRNRWATYLSELEERGLSRDPAVRPAKKSSEASGGGSCGTGCGCH